MLEPDLVLSQQIRHTHTRQSLQELIGPFLENPSAVASLVSALIAASVALLVVMVNQVFARRQQRVQFLQPKLEELYLLLNEVAERNTRLFKLLAAVVEGDLEAKKHLDSLDDLEVYGHSIAKKMVMLVRLYFPKLSSIHQHLFAAERDLSQRVWSLSMGEQVGIDEVMSASGRVGHMLRLMEQEMVSNQKALLRAAIFPKRYRPVSENDLMNVPAPPEGPPLSPRK